MRQYTRYARLRPRKKRGGRIYSLFTVLAIGVLAWVWWQQRIPSNPATQSNLTNEIDRANSTAQPLARVAGTNEPVIPIVKAKEPPRPGTNRVPEIAPRIAFPTNESRTPSEVENISSPPLSLTNVIPDTTSSIRIPRTILELQVALARQGISSGSIDGKLGAQTRAALRAFQEREHLPVSGAADEETKALLAYSEPLFTNYILSSNDLARLAPVSPSWLGKSQQERLEYETILELVAERGHAHPALIRSLNRGIDWTNMVAGAVLTIPNVRYPPAGGKAAFVRIRLGEKMLAAFDVGTNLLAHFPCSIARRVEKRPVGQLFVEKIAPNPNYRFDPEIFPESSEARELGRVLMIPPGPNNPVGTAWIGLDRPGYGIHGTPRPEEVGRTESHGCFRLANWNAEYLLQLVSVGTPVLVEP